VPCVLLSLSLTPALICLTLSTSTSLGDGVKKLYILSLLVFLLFASVVLPGCSGGAKTSSSATIPAKALELKNKGNGFFNSGNYTQAIVYYDQAIAVYPDYSDAWYNKGNALYSSQKYQDAITCYDKVISFDKNDAAAWNNKGVCLYFLGKPDQAIDCYDAALKIDNRNAGIWNSRGVALENLNRNDEAMVAFNNALIINPTYDIAQQNKKALTDKGIADKGGSIATDNVTAAK
jgi:tetratricopeptide (TPR) repeat protein